MSEFPYRYFVSYAHPRGFGMMEIGTDTPVTAFADVDEFRSTIVGASGGNFRSVEISIINFVLLSGPPAVYLDGTN